jgi:arsenate reductase
MSTDFKGRGTTDDPFTLLFLCTGNSARSIIAEAILNRAGEGRFRAVSAGSMPKGEVHPQTIKLLDSLGYETSQLRSKSWDEFSGTEAPEFDFIITVCDSAASETCPVWPGHPITAHWGLPDPAAVQGSPSDVSLAFADTYRMMKSRIDIFISLPVPSLSRMAAKHEINKIGQQAEVNYQKPDI